jgi:hypothetical protein
VADVAAGARQFLAVKMAKPSSPIGGFWNQNAWNVTKIAGKPEKSSPGSRDLRLKAIKLSFDFSIGQNIHHMHTNTNKYNAFSALDITITFYTQQIKQQILGTCE